MAKEGENPPQYPLKYLETPCKTSNNYVLVNFTAL